VSIEEMEGVDTEIYVHRSIDRSVDSSRKDGSGREVVQYQSLKTSEKKGEFMSSHASLSFLF
jgi:hypothetical protein